MANQTNGTAKQNKPLGIILVALYFAIVSGLLSLISSVPMLLMSGLSAAGWVTLFSIVSLAIGVLSLAACYGIWILVDWGRSLALAICAIDIPLSLIALKMPGIQTTSGTFILVVAGIALDVVIMYYLCTNNVKSLFSKPRR